MSDQFFEETLQNIRSSFRNLILALIASMSLFSIAAVNPQFEGLLQFGSDLQAFLNTETKYSQKFAEYQDRANALTENAHNTSIDHLTTEMKQSGFTLVEKDVRTLKSLSPAPTSTVKVSVGGSDEFRQRKTVFPTDLDFWLLEFPDAAGLNHYYQAPSGNGQKSAFQPFAKSWTGCQSEISFSPRCEYSSIPNSLLSLIGSTGTVADLGIWLEYRLEHPNLCSKIEGVKSTPYNYPGLSCVWTEIPDTSYVSAADELGLSIPHRLLEPPDKAVITDFLGAQKDVNGFLDSLRSKQEELESASFYTFTISVDSSELIVGLALSLFVLLFMFNVWHLNSYPQKVIRQVRNFPVLPLSDTQFFYFAWGGLGLFYAALIGQWAFFIADFKNAFLHWGNTTGLILLLLIAIQIGGLAKTFRMAFEWRSSYSEKTQPTAGSDGKSPQKPKLT